MSANVATLPTAAAIDVAWERYAALARAVTENPRLLLDREHAQAMAVAHDEWRTLFLAGRQR